MGTILYIRRAKKAFSVDIQTSKDAKIWIMRQIQYSQPRWTLSIDQQFFTHEKSFT